MISFSLRSALLRWYDSVKRPLPWRETSDPYAIWVSEVMLQQTQVATVIDYWRRWMARFPTIQALADSDEQEVLSLWQGLGYYRRCKLLRLGAQEVAASRMPSTAAEWLAVPGIGRYTAAAIASIAQGERAPLVDGNVERVYARLAGDASEGPALHKAAWEWASENIDRTRPGDWNQALMELGATVCKPAFAECGRCPLRPGCFAYAHEAVSSFPTPGPKPELVRLKQAVWVMVYEGKFGLRQIPAGQWWEGMWEFPRSFEGEAVRVGVVKHAVTKHRVTLDVFLAEGEDEALTWFSLDELQVLPLPAPQRRALELVLGAREQGRLF